MRVHPKKIVAYSGSKVNVTCLVEGNPVPLVTWKKAYGTQRGTTITTKAGKILSILNVGDQDVGYYICSAKNSEGSSSDAFSLYVTGKF